MGELHYLLNTDDPSKRLLNWKLSPKQSIKFILDSDKELGNPISSKVKGRSKKQEITI